MDSPTPRRTAEITPPTDVTSRIIAWTRSAIAKAASRSMPNWDAIPTAVNSNVKRRARLEAMRHVLHEVPYPSKDEVIVRPPDPEAKQLLGLDEK